MFGGSWGFGVLLPWVVGVGSFRHAKHERDEEMTAVVKEGYEDHGARFEILFSLSALRSTTLTPPLL